jgi:hypothetical protein
MSCEGGHTWTHQYGDDWTPDIGTLCDCGKKKWGIPETVVREHRWEFYMNGTFCKRCGAQLGSGQKCQ